MKKFNLFALFVIACFFIGCEPNNPVEEDSKAETDSSLDDEKSNCLVSLVSETSYVKASSISIEDKNGKIVGQGSFFGDYYVPYDGKIIVNYEYYCNYEGYNRPDCKKWYLDSFEIAVSSAQSLEVKTIAEDVRNDCHTYLVIYVNGAIWKTIEHE